MKIPSKVKVGGFIYKVIPNYKFKEIFDNLAQGDPNSLEIRIKYFDSGGEKLNQQKIEEMFLHEIVHCINEVYNSNKIDEDTITRLTMGLYQVLKDNKLLKE